MPPEGGATIALEQERATLEKRSTELAGNAGQYVLVHGQDVVGLFSSYADAIKAGYRTFGLEPFLVRHLSVPAQTCSVCSRMTLMRRMAP